MQCIILAGGLGTRLREVVGDVPKVLAPIRGVACIELLLHSLSRYKSIERVVLAVGYQKEKVIEALEGKKWPFELRFSIEEEPLGTGGAFCRASELIDDQLICLLNGDTFSDVDLELFMSLFSASGKVAGVVCQNTVDTTRYGSITLCGDLVVGFSEKTGEKSGYINAGIYAFDKNKLPSYPKKSFSLEKEYMPLLIERGVFGFPVEGFFLDIGTKESYAQAQQKGVYV